MKTRQEIKTMIRTLENDCEHVLTGSFATADINLPRALMQIEAETKLKTLHWVLGTEYESKLKGVNR